MKFSEYQHKALAHCSDSYETINKDLEHAILGLVTEAGELADLLKKSHFKPAYHLDRAKVVDELGDLMWYYALAAASIGATQEEICDKNLAKLDVRYNKNNGEKDRDAESLAQEAVGGEDAIQAD